MNMVQMIVTTPYFTENMDASSLSQHQTSTHVQSHGNTNMVTL